jgi:DNA-binding NarL/FixJ family response regulator
VTIRVLVADDQEVVRAGYIALLGTQPDMTVVGSAANGAEAVRLCRELRPDVVLMDVRMPVVDGVEATRQLLAEHAGDGGAAGGGPRVLMLTTFDLDQHVYEALSAGASGFLLKDIAAERLFEAVRLIADGEARNPAVLCPRPGSQPSRDPALQVRAPATVRRSQRSGARSRRGPPPG